MIGCFVRGVLGLAATSALLSLGAAARAAEIPLPADVPALDRPAELVLGSQPVAAQEFSTRLPVEELRAFYERELPKQGWGFLAFPWMEQAQRYPELLEQAAQEHAEEIAADPSLQEQVRMAREGWGALQEQLGGSLYAGQGAERLLLRFAPEAGRTLVTVQRWTQTSQLGGSFAGFDVEAPIGMAGQPPSGQPSWPAANPCCSGEAVPEGLRQLPSSVPRYPTGRMLSTGMDSMGQALRQVMSEVYLTEDAPEQALEFYRTHMAYNGWAIEDTSAVQQQAAELLGPGAEQLETGMLMFRMDKALCGVVVASWPGVPQASWAQGPNKALSASPLMAEVAKGVGESAEASSKERTVITVTYLELDPAMLKRAQTIRQRAYGDLGR